MVGQLLVFDARADCVQTKSYKVRRAHTKSRLGCKTCKLRRVKCDEAKPICTHCQRKDLPCAYPNPVKFTTCSPPTTLFWPGVKSPDVLTKTNTYNTPFDLSMLQHFVQRTSHSLFDPGALMGAQDIDIISLATQHAHIMHVVVAVAALHLTQTTSSGTAYTELEANHWNAASSTFRNAISLYSLQTNPDPLLTTSMLINLLAFANIGEATIAFGRNRWPFTRTDSEDLRWLRVQLGLSPLLSGLSQRTKGDSIWLPLFLSTGTMDMYDERQGTEGVPEKYWQLFEIDETSNCLSSLGPVHPYLRLIRRILTLRKLYGQTSTQRGHNLNVMKYIQFMQAVDMDVVERLEARDLRTLLLYAHCMAVLAAVDNWWARPRAMSECRAVTMWLMENANVGKRWEDEGWFDWPRSMCGMDGDVRVAEIT